jgi:hypothetical protein
VAPSPEGPRRARYAREDTLAEPLPGGCGYLAAGRWPGRVGYVPIGGVTASNHGLPWLADQ